MSMYIIIRAYYSNKLEQKNISDHEVCFFKAIY